MMIPCRLSSLHLSENPDQTETDVTAAVQHTQYYIDYRAEVLPVEEGNRYE